MDDMWVLLAFFSKVIATQPNGILLFPRLFFHSCFFTAHSPQQLFQKPQPNQTHPRFTTYDEHEETCQSQTLESKLSARSAPFRNAGQGGPPLPVPSEAQPAAEHDERSARVWLWIRRTVALRRRVEWT